jgi:hypothetical protein
VVVGEARWIASRKFCIFPAVAAPSAPPARSAVPATRHHVRPVRPQRGNRLGPDVVDALAVEPHVVGVAALAVPQIADEIRAFEDGTDGQAEQRNAGHALQLVAHLVPEAGAVDAVHTGDDPVTGRHHPEVIDRPGGCGRRSDLARLDRPVVGAAVRPDRDRRCVVEVGGDEVVQLTTALVGRLTRVVDPHGRREARPVLEVLRVDVEVAADRRVVGDAALVPEGLDPVVDGVQHRPGVTATAGQAVHGEVPLVAEPRTERVPAGVDRVADDDQLVGRLGQDERDVDPAADPARVGGIVVGLQEVDLTGRIGIAGSAADGPDMVQHGVLMRIALAVDRGEGLMGPRPAVRGRVRTGLLNHHDRCLQRHLLDRVAPLAAVLCLVVGALHVPGDQGRGGQWEVGGSGGRDGQCGYQARYGQGRGY